MEEDYAFGADDDEDEDLRPRKQKLTKNQQIYGDFFEAYEQEEKTVIRSRSDSYYQRFRVGETIENYSAEVEVHIPKKKPKIKDPLIIGQEDDDDGEERPMIGSFTLKSFLAQVNEADELEKIEEEEEEIEDRPKGMNPKILTKLKLIKIGEELEEELDKLDEMDFQRYMRSTQPAKRRPKYETQEERDLAKQFSEGYGVGFKMMESMGYKITKGLGKDETGLNRPIEAVSKRAFTTKDPAKGFKANQGQDDEQPETEEEEQKNIPEKLFGYKSKDPKINDFLLSLKNKYESLHSRTYYYRREIDSFDKDKQISESLRLQKNETLFEARKQLNKLKILSQSLQPQEVRSKQAKNSRVRKNGCSSLSLHYKLDQLEVKKCYQKIMDITDISRMNTVAKAQLGNLSKRLNSIYLEIEEQKMKEYEKVTGFEQKMKKSHRAFNSKASKQKNFTKQKQVIDLDEGDEERDNQVIELEIAEENAHKMSLYFEILVERILKQVEAYLLSNRNTITSILSNESLVDLLELLRKYDSKCNVVPAFLKQKIVPFIKDYLATVSFEQYTKGQQKILPHAYVLSWAILIPIKQINLRSFFQRVMTYSWGFADKALLDILTPFLKYSGPQQLHLVRELYLYPKIMYEMERFSLSSTDVETSKAILIGLNNYKPLLDSQTLDDIVSNTILAEIEAVFSQYKRNQQMNEKDLKEWLGRWKKKISKIAPGCFEKSPLHQLLH